MHRNSQTRYYGEYIYSITCNTQNRIPFFKNKIFCEIWMDVLKKTKEMKKFNLYAFCLNYDHFHILVGPNEEIANISQIMQALKKNVSQDINKMILGDNECLQNDLMVISANTNSRLQGEEEQNALGDTNKPNFGNDEHLKNDPMVISANSHLQGEEEQNALQDINKPNFGNDERLKNYPMVVSANSRLQGEEEQNRLEDANKLSFGNDEHLKNDPMVISANTNSRLQGEEEQNRLEDANKLSFGNDKHLKNDLMVVSANSHSRMYTGANLPKYCNKNIGYKTNKDMHGATNKYGKFQRQKSFHDHIVRNERDFIEHFKYIEYNYLKHNLPNNRKYTSRHNKDFIDSLEF